MSVQSMAHVWAMDLPHSEAFVLLAMADHADQDGENIFPSIRKIAWKTGYSVRAVQRIRDKLLKRGILKLVTTITGAPTMYMMDHNAATKKKPFEAIKRTPCQNDIPHHPCQNDTHDTAMTGGGVTQLRHGGDDIATTPKPSSIHQLQPSKENGANAQDTAILSTNRVFHSMPSPSPAQAEPPSSARPAKKSKYEFELSEAGRDFVNQWKAGYLLARRYPYTSIGDPWLKDKKAVEQMLADGNDPAELLKLAQWCWESNREWPRKLSCKISTFINNLGTLREEMTPPAKSNPNMSNQITERLSVPILRIS